MKKFLLLILAGYLSACGGFQIEVEVNPIQTAPPAPTSTGNQPGRTASPFGMKTGSPAATLQTSATIEPGYVHPTNTPAATLTSIPPLTPGQPVSFSGLHMRGSTGWGVSVEGRILHTLDGGTSWSDVTPPQGRAFTDSGLYAPDPNFAWAAAPTSTGAQVWYTFDYTDSHRAWISAAPINLRDLDAGTCGPLTFPGGMTGIDQLAFIDSKTGFLVGHAQGRTPQHDLTVSLLFSSSDSGMHWELRHLSTIDCSTGGGPDTMKSVYFTGPKSGWAGFFPSKWSYYPYNQERYIGGWDIYQTEDGGQTWQQVELPEPADFAQQVAQPEVAPYNAACGIGEIIPLAHDIFGLRLSCFIYAGTGLRFDYYYLTFDGGANWNYWQASGNEDFFVNVYSNNVTTGWRFLPPAGSQFGLLQDTFDGGRTWVTMKTVAWKSASLDFVNALEGWAIVSDGMNSALVHTVNGGWTWSDLKPVVANP